MAHVHNRESLLLHGFTTEIASLTHTSSSLKMINKSLLSFYSCNVMVNRFLNYNKLHTTSNLLENSKIGVQYLMGKSENESWMQIGLNSSQLMQSK